jgi:hypothetical protein
MAVKAITWTETGVTLYARGRRPSDDKIWNANVAAPAWEVEDTANVADYTLQHDTFAAETPVGGYRYQVTIPAAWAAGDYELEWYRRVGAAAAITDIYLLTTAFEWDGAAVIVNATKVRDANAAQISGDATAADNLEAAFEANGLGILLGEICGIEAYGAGKVDGLDMAGPYRFAGFHDGLPYFVSITATGYLWWSSAAGEWRVSVALDEAVNFLSYTPQNFEFTYENFGINGNAVGTVVFYLTPYIGGSNIVGGSILTDLLPGNAAETASAANLATLAGKFAGITIVANWLRGLYRKDAMNAAAKGEVNAIHDGGAAGAFNETTDSLEALRDRGDAAWVTASPLSAQATRDAMKLAPGTGAPATGSIDLHLDDAATAAAAAILATPAQKIATDALGRPAGRRRHGRGRR